MKVRVKLYGTLSKSYSGYDSASGIHLDVPDGTCVRDVTEMVKVSEASLGIVTINGKLAKTGDLICEGDDLKFFQPIAGG